MQTEKIDYEELSERFSLISGSYEQLYTILDKLRCETDVTLDSDIILSLINSNLFDWGQDALSKVKFYEELTQTLLDDKKEKKKNEKTIQAA